MSSLPYPRETIHGASFQPSSNCARSHKTARLAIDYMRPYDQGIEGLVRPHPDSETSSALMEGTQFLLPDS